jgi:hypothetical protein
MALGETPDGAQLAAPVQQDTASTEALEGSTQTVEAQDSKNPGTKTAETDALAEQKHEQKDKEPVEKAGEITDDALKTAGFDQEDLLKRVAENGGKVPDDVREELRKTFSDEAIKAATKDVEESFSKRFDMNDYIYNTLANGDTKKGVENFKTLSEWCRGNMDKTEIDAINTLLRSDNRDVVRKGLQQAVDAWKKGTEKPMMSGNAEATHTAKKEETFEPLHEMQFRDIMRSKKYQEDPEYASKIDNRRRETIARIGDRPDAHGAYSPVRPPFKG